MLMMGSSYEPERQQPHRAPAAALPVNEEWPFFSDDDDIRNNSRSQTGKRLDRSKKTTGHVLLEGYVGASEGESELTRAKSLTDDDLDELRGCLDLGFGFSYEEIPQLCSTLPALELCYSMTQRFLDEQQSPSPDVCRTASSSVASWRISAPGDHPEDVKARLKFWATVQLRVTESCSRSTTTAYILNPTGHFCLDGVDDFLHVREYLPFARTEASA